MDDDWEQDTLLGLWSLLQAGGPEVFVSVSHCRARELLPLGSLSPLALSTKCSCCDPLVTRDAMGMLDAEMQWGSDVFQPLQGEKSGFIA